VGFQVPFHRNSSFSPSRGWNEIRNTHYPGDGFYSPGPHRMGPAGAWGISMAILLSRADFGEPSRPRPGPTGVHNRQQLVRFGAPPPGESVAFTNVVPRISSVNEIQSPARSGSHGRAPPGRDRLLFLVARLPSEPEREKPKTAVLRQNRIARESPCQDRPRRGWQDAFPMLTEGSAICGSPPNESEGAGPGDGRTSIR
jgi:hypothetical protein